MQKCAMAFLTTQSLAQRNTAMELRLYCLDSPKSELISPYYQTFSLGGGNELIVGKNKRTRHPRGSTRALGNASS